MIDSYFNCYTHFGLGNMKNVQVIILTTDTLCVYHSLLTLNVDRTYLILIFNVVNTVHMDFKTVSSFQPLVHILVLYIQAEEYYYIAKNTYIFVYKHSLEILSKYIDYKIQCKTMKDANYLIVLMLWNYIKEKQNTLK